MVSSIIFRSRLCRQVLHKSDDFLTQITRAKGGSRAMGSYTSDWPTSTQVDEAYKTFFEEFYKISDMPGAHDKYLSQFTKDATFIVGSKKATGSDEILTMRHGMWEKVAARKHNPIKVFPFGANSDELMLYGTVEYELKAGGKAGIDWAAHARMSKAEGDVKMSFYQVYLDTGAQSSK